MDCNINLEENSSLRKHQLRILEIVKEFDRICELHSIPYWIEGGTLLGAIRHKGFIPWDDDLDVQILRKDKKKLLSILEKELPPTMVLQVQKNDKYYLRHLIRIRDLNSRLNVSNLGDWSDYKYQGVFIDIFTMDSTLYLFSKFRKLIHIMYWKRIMLWGRILKNKPKVKFMPFYLWYKLESLCSLLCVCLAKSFCLKKLTYSEYGIDYYGLELSEDEIFPLKKVQFEDTFLNAPNKTEQILRKVYGDYMKLPPIEQRKPNHSIEVFFYN